MTTRRTRLADLTEPQRRLVLALIDVGDGIDNLRASAQDSGMTTSTVTKCPGDLAGKTIGVCVLCHRDAYVSSRDFAASGVRHTATAKATVARRIAEATR